MLTVVGITIDGHGLVLGCWLTLAFQLPLLQLASLIAKRGGLGARGVLVNRLQLCGIKRDINFYTPPVFLSISLARVRIFETDDPGFSFC